MTSGTSTLNIIQIQKLAFDEERIQSQMEDLIKQMIEVKAKRVAAYNKSRDETASQNSSEASSEPEIQQKDSTLDFKAFTTEF